jgi:murein DD-endopeptidase MepM/ murein hydrolase activator NlpD
LTILAKTTLKMKFFCCLFLISSIVFGQNQYPKDYFISPLDIPLQLSGNFGELRPNHFHAGFDFKTQKKEGLKVYAVADGYVSRIKISHGGYGKAIYISHPNGFTTVYGHLKSSFGDIEEFIKKEQYKTQSYEIEILLNPDQLIVKKGQIIALSGNTGGSDGPHLHFEFRDSESEKIINPLFFGFDVQILDTKRPSISSLMVYPIEKNSIVNQSLRPISLNLSLQADGSYIAEKVMAYGKIGFGFNAIDFDNVSWNVNGIYKVQSFLNGKLFFGYHFDTFSFDETKYINALIDYERYKTMGQKIQKLFMKKPYPLSLIQSTSENGIISVTSNINQIFRIELSDFNENTTKICIPIQYSALAPKLNESPITSKYFVKSQKDNMFSKDNVTVTIPANTFYEDFYINFEVKNEILQLHKDIVPAFSNFSITFEDSVATEKEREKMFIASINEKKIYHLTTKRYKNTFTAYTKYLGQYKLIKDTIGPKISISKNIEGNWISMQSELRITISDSLSGIKTYKGYLNKKWILLEYESKTNKLTHSFADGIVSEGKNELQIEVTDNVGNSTIFETHFFRSQKP